MSLLSSPDWMSPSRVAYMNLAEKLQSSAIWASTDISSEMYCKPEMTREGRRDFLVTLGVYFVFIYLFSQSSSSLLCFVMPGAVACLRTKDQVLQNLHFSPPSLHEVLVFSKTTIQQACPLHATFDQVKT